MEKRTIGAMNAQTIMLIQRLEKMAEGEIITHAEMSKVALGADLRGKQSYMLATARKHCENSGVMFGTLSGIGLKRLTPPEVVTESGKDMRRVEKTSLRALRKLALVDKDRLTDADCLRRNSNMMTLAVANHFTKPANQERMLTAVKDNNALTMKETLRLFGK